MKTNMGYTAGGGGAVCSRCGDIIETAEYAVLMMPAQIDYRGSAQPTSEVIHGVLHVSCFKDL